MNDRVKVDDLGSVIAEVASALGSRIREKGDLSFASNHEALGIITEEYYEFVEAVHSASFTLHSIPSRSAFCLYIILALGTAFCLCDLTPTSAFCLLPTNP